MQKLRCVVMILLLSGTVHSTPSTSNALHLDWLNPSASRHTHFYDYANGGWQQRNPIPADHASWNAFSVLALAIQTDVHALVRDASMKTPVVSGSLMQKVGDFYFSGMNVAAINRLGASPLQPELTRILAIRTLPELAAEIAHLHSIGVDALFAFGSMQDFKHSDRMIGAIMQSGLSLPDRDFYLQDDTRIKVIRAAFVEYMTRLFELLGDSSAEAARAAATVLRIETTLARASLPQAALRDPHAIYHMVSVKALNQQTHHFVWTDYLKAMGRPDVVEVNAATPEFIHAMDQALVQTPVADWVTYLRWHLISTYAAYLSQPFVDATFHMQQVLLGVEQLLPRWKRVVSTESGILGFAIGELYIAEHDFVKVRPKVLEIIQNIHAVLRDDLSTRRWMSKPIRQAALAKLALMEERVGGPSVSWDYQTYAVDRGPYVLNVLRGYQFLVRRDLNKIGQPIDRREWEMTPQTINAYYDPSMNNINIPYGILQSPFFELTAPDAVNYGAIGSVIGHEITHGFDDQGAQFDGHGNLRNWWTPHDLQQFKAATTCLANQFSQYTVADNAHVNGQLVVGEATADLGGLTLAYRAFRRSDAYRKAKTVHGFTPDQQFFLSFAHVWAGNVRPEQARVHVMTDPHPPAMYRVNGTLANMPEFRKAFGLPESNGSTCAIW